MSKLSREQGLNIYLGLGAGRSLRRVRLACGPDAVSPRTLDNWSKQDAWPARAKAHDAEVAAEAQRKVAKAQAAEQASTALCIETFVRAAFKRATELVAKAETVKDLEAIIDKAVEAQKQLEVMEGRVSDRTAVVAPSARAATIEEEFGLVEPAGTEAPAKPH